MIIQQPVHRCEIKEKQSYDSAFFEAKARQAPSGMHEMVFAGRKNMSTIVRMFACEIE